MKITLCLAMLFLLGPVRLSMAESFVLGSNANGIAGLASATINQGSFELSLEAGPTGAVFNESDSDGAGINTRGISGVIDGGASGDPDKFNIIDGAAAVSGTGEFAIFSFDQPGVLETLLFDGLKDETLEYFTVEFRNSSIVTFFDSQVESRLADQGFLLSDLGVPNPTIAPTEDDDYEDVEYAFAAGEQFKVTYGQIDFTNVLPGYVPVGGGSGNGARFQGVVVRAIPEPSALVLSVIVLHLGLLARSKTWITA